MEAPRTSVMDYVFAEIGALTPTVEARKAGTPHEGHDGWGMSHLLPGRYQCSCGESIDDLLGLPPIEVWHIAACLDCGGDLRHMKQPFRDPGERDRWADQHETVGHRVARYEEKW